MILSKQEDAKAFFRKLLYWSLSTGEPLPEAPEDMDSDEHECIHRCIRAFNDFMFELPQDARNELRRGALKVYERTSADETTTTGA